MRLRYSILILAAHLLLVGCTVGPNYAKPKLAVAPAYSEAGLNENTNPPPAAWWKTFNDPELDKLISAALHENYDLRVAYSRVRQSRFQRNLIAAGLFPQVDADAGYIHARGSKNVVLPLGGAGASGGSGAGAIKTAHSSSVTPKASSQNSASPSASSSPAGAQTDNAFDDQLTPFGKGGLPGEVTDLYQAGFDATWEIDVFGARRRQVEAANADLGAANENRRQMALTIMAEVGRDYFELRGIQARLQIAQQNLATQSNILALTRSQAQAGLAQDADVIRAQAQVESTAATIPPLVAQVRTLSHALSILVGQEPQALDRELGPAMPLPPNPPVVAVGLPSDLIERRPDLRAAERSVAAANARVGGATADLFPKFALTANAGLDSSALHNLFDLESRYFLISPTVTWRIFDAGQILSNIRLQNAMKNEAELEYRATLLKALQEVEDALVAYGTEQERQGKLATAYQEDKVAMDLMSKRYEHGLVTFLDVLDSERTVLSAQDALAQSNSASIIDLVALYKALGGGWK